VIPRLTYVCAHGWSFLERNDLEAIFAALNRLLLGHVAESHKIFWYLYLELEGCLEVGLVEAGKRSSGVASLELGAEHIVILAIGGDPRGWSDGGLIPRTVEAFHGIVHAARVFDGNDRLAGRDTIGELDSCALVGFVITDILELRDCGYFPVRSRYAA
jgi:hypothetical protein